MEKMARVTTALGSTAISGCTMFCHLDAPANAISVCRDAAQVVVAGRNIFKIYALEENQFVEKLNLRVGRKPSLNFSCADVMWHQMDENLLATAATNGAVVTWNLGKPCRNKQDQLFTEHKRTVNKVCFHPTEVYMLLSGSQDGYMKCFDLRKKESVSTFSGITSALCCLVKDAIGGEATVCCSLASSRAVGKCERCAVQYEGTTSHLLRLLRTATCSCGTSGGRTGMRGCSLRTLDLFSAATGTLRTGL